MKKINISIFSGGSGNAELARNFCELDNKTNNINLNFIINGYDDGKSTGFIRRLFPGMLGPSDFRKNCNNIIIPNNQTNNTLKKILNYRFKNFESYVKFFNKIKKKDKKYFEFIDRLPWNKYLKFVDMIIIFNNYISKKKFLKYEFSDISLGNIIFAAYFLYNRKNFNKTIKHFSNFFEIKHKILNVTNGQNLYLCGLTKNGEILEDEVSIIENKKKESIIEIFLIKEKLSPRNLKKLIKIKNLDKKRAHLKKLNIQPSLNQELKSIIKNSDVIIYGPGTQNSSLYPSYLTKGLRNIVSNSKAKKIFISNIFKDNDIVNESTSSIIDKFFYYFDSKKEEKKLVKNKLINYYFVHKTDEKDINNLYQKYYLSEDLKKKKEIFKFDWEKSRGIHFSNLIVNKIFQIIKKKNFFEKNRSFQTLSIILPCLNEKNKLNKVLKDITNYKLKDFNLSIELIFVDGGSTDGSLIIAKRFKELKIYSLKNKKRGECIDFGIKNAKGDIILIFPTDGEFSVSDIQNLVSQIYLRKSEVVFGSRLIKNLDPSKMIKKVYGKNIFLYYLSKFGGMAISAFTLILFNRFLTDPLTTFKCFNSSVVKNLHINAKGVNYDIEQYLKFYEKGVYVDEQPVNYKARSYKDGKKTNFIDGLSCIYTLLKNKFF